MPKLWKHKITYIGDITIYFIYSKAHLYSKHQQNMASTVEKHKAFKLEDINHMYSLSNG